MSNLALSPSENAFVDALLDLGDADAAAAVAGVQPALGRDPRVQSALVDRIREHGALDAVYARKVLRELAAGAENEGVRFRAAAALWERGLGKVPDEVKVGITVEHIDRATLYSEIRQLIGELGLPPALEGEFEEVGPPKAGAPRIAQSALAERSEAPPAQIAEAEASPAAHGGASADGPGAGSSPAAGTYVPDIPFKWK